FTISNIDNYFDRKK
ncbi:MAG: hypothetical protein V4487_09160, partial [Chlamydiota bacterium]